MLDVELDAVAGDEEAVVALEVAATTETTREALPVFPAASVTEYVSV